MTSTQTDRHDNMALRLKRTLAILLVTVCGCAGFGMALDASAATAEPLLWERCQQGDGTGQCDVPGGVAADSNSGSVYVIDTNNFRVTEFSPWGTFLKSWGWGVADGQAELQTCGPAATPPTASCRRGIKGGGPGQFYIPGSIAVDSAGSVYVYEAKQCIGGEQCFAGTNRVQKFSASGDFILMFGREVNLTKVAEREAQEAASEPVTVSADEENVCTAASGDNCGAGKVGGGPGEFGSGSFSSVDPSRSFLIASGPGNEIRVAGQERIQVFDLGGHFQETIPVPGRNIRALAVDSSGGNYIIPLNGGQSADEVQKLSASGAEICTAKISNPRNLAVDAQGRFYVSQLVGILGQANFDVLIHRFAPGCAEEPGYAFAIGLVEKDASVPSGLATSSACGINGNLYYAHRPDALSGGTTSLSFVRAYFPPPDPTLCPPPALPPTIGDQHAVSVGSTSAAVRAKISTNFWPDATYYVQFGTEDCNSVSDACDQTALFPGAHLSGKQDQPVPTPGVFLSDLQPNTTYHYRFVAQSAGGGPVFGVGDAEEDATFTTYPAPASPQTTCPNQVFRTGASASLPDCRAYEMVSPVDKDGGELAVGKISIGSKAWLNLGAGSGERVTYSSYRAFPGSVSGPFSSQYLSGRGSTGWSTEPISPPIEGTAFMESFHLDALYKGFDDELCDGWLWQPTEPALAPDAISGYTNLYRRQGCGPVSFEALTQTAPMFDPSKGEQPLPPETFLPELVGFSADNRHTIFQARGRLTTDAPPCAGGTGTVNTCPGQLYEFNDGALHLVCVLPNGEPSKIGCWAGSRVNPNNHRHNVVQHAISDDGSRIFWTSKIVEPGASESYGRLYVRIDRAETRPISANPARFWAAAADGSRVVYTSYSNSAAAQANNGDLYLTDVDSGEKTLIARKARNVLGVSEDARRLYVASTEALTGDEENSQGDHAEPGQLNLYFYEAGEGGGLTFVAALNQLDLDRDNPSSLTQDPFYRMSRITPDGLHAAFTSLNPLTGADNVEVSSGEPVTEVFLYDAAARKLRCVSCSPANSRPQGRQWEREPESLAEPWLGGFIPGWPNQIRASRPLSDDGQRVFFESYEPLLPTDTNGKGDVYEWEAAESAAACEAKGAQLFLAHEGGCLSLISSGESPADSTFIDASRSGRDVFIGTSSSLVPQDPGLIDVYDAREGGGFPPPPPPLAACEGEACQGAYSPPQDPTPASSTFQGPGNVDEKPRKPKKHRKPRAHQKQKKHQQKQKRHEKKKQKGNAGAARGKGGQL